MKLPLCHPPRKEIIVEMRFPPEELTEMTDSDIKISKRQSIDATVVTISTLDMSSSSDAASGVRFDLESTVYIPITALADMTDDERRDAWYTKENYDIIMGANNITAKLMRIGRENPEAFGHCFRGLENRLPECRKDRDDRTRNASRVVFDEQKQQRETGMYDPKSLAKLYRLSTLSSLEIALTRAELDAQVASIYQEEHASSTPPPQPPQSRQHSRQSLSKTTKRESTPSLHTNSPSKDVLKLKVAIQEEDEVSVLSDEVTNSNPDIMYATEGRGLVRRLRHFIQKTQHVSSGSSKASSVSGSSCRQRSRR